MVESSQTFLNMAFTFKFEICELIRHEYIPEIYELLSHEHISEYIPKTQFLQRH